MGREKEEEKKRTKQDFSYYVQEGNGLLLGEACANGHNKGDMFRHMCQYIISKHAHMRAHTHLEVLSGRVGWSPARRAGGPGSLPGRSVYQRLISRIFTAGGSVAI